MTTSFIKPPPSNYLLCSLFGSAVVIKTQQIIRAFFPNLCVKIKEGFIRTRTCETKKSFLVRNLFSCCKGFYSFAHRNYCAAFLLRICRFIVYSIIVTFITTPPPLTAPGNSEIFGAPASPFGGSLTGCALKTGYPSWRTRSPGARASIGTMESGRKTGKGRFPIRTGCALPLILRWRNAPLIWTNCPVSEKRNSMKKRQ